MSKKLVFVDLFCGAGGTSTGAALAARQIDRDIKMIGVNHWDLAIETHSKNHPDSELYHTDIERISPSKIVPGGRVHLLVASPECIHHSRARGGKPRDDQSRSSVDAIFRWLDRLYVDNVLIENVPEFIDWGPLDAKGQPIKSKKGVLFQNFIHSLQLREYNVEWKVLTCANYGDPTTRQRCFVLATRKKGHNVKPVWPNISHIPHHELQRNEASMFPYDVAPWVPASSIIDWSYPSQSIFTRKRPLKPNTMRRIEAGIRKFWGEPFLTMMYGTNDTRDLGRPLPTVTTANHMGLVQPLLIPNEGYFRGNAARTVDNPLQSVTSRGAGAILEPFFIPSKSGGAPRSTGIPLHTITAQARGEGFLQGFVMTNNGKPVLRSTGQPVPTITAGGGGKMSLVEPFLVQYNGTSEALPTSAPMPTLSTKERHALVQAVVNGDAYIDIHYRMLQPHELAAAMSFPKDYQFAGNKSDVVKQIGNAVPVCTAQALCSTLLQRFV